jgi:ribosomal-protein-alanine N-acetyltransferase
MNSQRLEIGEGFHLAPIRASDKAAYLEHFADPEIGRMLLAVPVPYTEADADKWIAHRLKNALKHEIQFGIRVADGSLIGGIGLVEERSTAIYRGEIGYWLAREYRGRGLMPRAIRVFADYAFRELQLHKLTATTYPFNSPLRAPSKRLGLRLKAGSASMFAPAKETNTSTRSSMDLSHQTGRTDRWSVKEKRCQPTICVVRLFLILR